MVTVRVYSEVLERSTTITGNERFVRCAQLRLETQRSEQTVSFRLFSFTFNKIDFYVRNKNVQANSEVACKRMPRLVQMLHRGVTFLIQHLAVDYERLFWILACHVG